MVWELINKARADGFKEFEIQGANQKRLSEFKSSSTPGWKPITLSRSAIALAVWRNGHTLTSR